MGCRTALCTQLHTSAGFCEAKGLVKQGCICQNGGGMADEQAAAGRSSVRGGTVPDGGQRRPKRDGRLAGTPGAWGARRGARQRAKPGKAATRAFEGGHRRWGRGKNAGRGARGRGRGRRAAGACHAATAAAAGRGGHAAADGGVCRWRPLAGGGSRGGAVSDRRVFQVLSRGPRRGRAGARPARWGPAPSAGLGATHPSPPEVYSAKKRGGAARGPCIASTVRGRGGAPARGRLGPRAAAAHGCVAARRVVPLQCGLGTGKGPRSPADRAAAAAGGILLAAIHDKLFPRAFFLATHTGKKGKPKKWSGAVRCRGAQKERGGG
ncbi:hypothetical protein Rsub_00380 [Raphidocelis subcapitata]|uniref:Uncharacterized protein n=1 Tax=Raphidocelis subcapitata TaxID=307507 RepID=A0A2V0NKW1_9CHLO|nr:hypothetical protein Rsub_00380 [Raphidocelis subcapitata]|eukprot:GBF87669.1 hypothetical protein Rsub_00380 [Raphidocelis subcapitata]